MKWGCIDLATGVLVVRESFWGPTKNGKPRGLMLPAPTVQALRRYKASQARALLALGIRQDEETYIVTDPVGGQMPPAAPREAFRALCTEHGFDLTATMRRRGPT